MYSIPNRPVSHQHTLTPTPTVHTYAVCTPSTQSTPRMNSALPHCRQQTLTAGRYKSHGDTQQVPTAPMHTQYRWPVLYP